MQSIFHLFCFFCFRMPSTLETPVSNATSTSEPTSTTATTTTTTAPSNNSNNNNNVAAATKKRCWRRRTVHFTVFLAVFSTILSLLWVYTLTAELRFVEVFFLYIRCDVGGEKSWWFSGGKVPSERKMCEMNLGDRKKLLNKKVGDFSRSRGKCRNGFPKRVVWLDDCFFIAWFLKFYLTTVIISSDSWQKLL